MKVVDSLRSLVTGLGTSKDKGASAEFVGMLINDQELSAMHRADWLARKVVDIIPNDMTREWRDWQADEKQIEAIESLEKAPAINLVAKVNLALQTARLFGGSILYMGMKDNKPEQALDLERVGKGDLQYVHVWARTEAVTGPLVQDIGSPEFGRPAYFEVPGPDNLMVRLHPSRVIQFCGAPVLDRRLATQGWGDSVLQVVYTAVRNAASAQEHTAALIPEAKVDIIYIPGLGEHASSEKGRQQLTNRFTYANTMKSMLNALLLDGTGGGPNGQGEKWEQKQISFAQLPELIRQYLQIAAGAADIPVTRLLGESPAGLNSTGKSDLQNYYDNIAARQRIELSPALHKLDEVLIRSATGSRDEAIYYEWAPLWGLTEKERADILNTKAQAARTIAGTGGASPALIPLEALSDALVNALVEDGSLPGLEAAIEEFGRLADQEEDEAEVEAAALPSPQPAPADA
ncbi:MAG: DUF1073 domain-containing protein [Caulobacteraceae bacterium]|nr:DUF1073 domain-containing protein [Caulobacteraceae bacterium]